MKKLIWTCTLLFVFVAIAGCASSTPPQKTEVNITPPAVNVTPPTVIVTPPVAPKVEVNITTPPVKITPNK